MRFYTTQILSANRHLTSEGYLACDAVPIARTGTMLYAAGEVPVRSKDGVIEIERLPEDVFSADAMRSFEGKPITLNHPGEDVTPRNWAALAKGTMHNVRRGEGTMDAYLVADLLITDHYAISQVRDKGLREVSAGYDADYEEIAPGLGRQTGIFGNHLALVPRGRCGTRCSIGDEWGGDQLGDDEMKLTTKFFDRVRAAFTTSNSADFEAALAAMTKDAEEETEEEKKKRLAEEKEKTKDAVMVKLLDSLKTIDGRLAKLETRDDDDETEEEKKKRLAKEKKDREDKEGTEDSAGLAETVRDTFARAEILSPGLHVPTFDTAAKKTATIDSLCLLKRKALSTALDAGKYRDAIEPFLGKTPDFKTLSCAAVDSAFLGASEIVRRDNNAQSRVTFDGGKAAANVANSVAAINKANADFWSRS